MTSSFRLPAEWEPQSAVQLTWPHDRTDWSEQLDQVERLYIQISVEIAQRQQLLLVHRDPVHRIHIQGQLSDAGIDPQSLCFVQADSNDSWARDHGPITRIEHGLQARPINFQFNGWGGKYPADQDNWVTVAMEQQRCFQTDLAHVDLILEGGAIETDGAGTLLATRSSVITASRNPGMEQPQIERLLESELGLRHFLWLDHGQLSGDDTDGHIDTLARFVDDRTILHVTTHPDDPDHSEVQAMIEQLRGFHCLSEEPYRLVPLPPIEPIHDEAGNRLPATYANFLFINGAVLLPVYGDPNDQAAIDCLVGCFPQREIVPIDCRPLIRQNGSLHCITMQFPAALQLG